VYASWRKQGKDFDMTVETTTKDKQITIEVPEERVAEFYAFFGHFLAGSRRRRGGPHPRGHRHGPGRHGHRCGPHGEHEHADETVPAEPSQPEQSAGPGPEPIA
jgi:hypothetical protein